jgi:hypothetical protein
VGRREHTTKDPDDPRRHLKSRYGPRRPDPSSWPGRRPERQPPRHGRRVSTPDSPNADSPRRSKCLSESFSS